MELNRMESECRDILPVEIIVLGKKLIVVLVYMDVRDLDRNRVIYGEIDKIMNGIGEGVPVAILGDFNGHVGFLGSPREKSEGRNDVGFCREMESGHVKCR